MNLEAGRFWENPVPAGVLAIRPKDREAILEAAEPMLDRVVIIAFGSRVEGRTSRSSDLDLAIDDRRLTVGEWHLLADRLEEAPIPYVLDVVRLSRLAPDSPLWEPIRRRGVRIWPE